MLGIIGIIVNIAEIVALGGLIAVLLRHLAGKK